MYEELTGKIDHDQLGILPEAESPYGMVVDRLAGKRADGWRRLMAVGYRGRFRQSSGRQQSYVGTIVDRFARNYRPSGVRSAPLYIA